jgi:hypothetical protein
MTMEDYSSRLDSTRPKVLEALEVLPPLNPDSVEQQKPRPDNQIEMDEVSLKNFIVDKLSEDHWRAMVIYVTILLNLLEDEKLRNNVFFSNQFDLEYFSRLKASNLSIFTSSSINLVQTEYLRRLAHAREKMQRVNDIVPSKWNQKLFSILASLESMDLTKAKRRVLERRKKELSLKIQNRILKNLGKDYVNVFSEYHQLLSSLVESLGYNKCLSLLDPQDVDYINAFLGFKNKP